MKKSYTFMFLAFFFAVVFVFSASPASAKKVLIKLQQAYGANLPTLGINPAWWAEQLKEMSGGDINIKIYETRETGGAL